MTRIIISGVCGKMGKSIGLLASGDKSFKIVGALESIGNPAVGKQAGEILGIDLRGVKIESDFSKIADGCSVLIEFTSPEATIEHLAGAIKKKIGVVIGTTNFTPGELEDIKKASTKIPIVFSPNMSVGANLLFKLTEEVSRGLGEDYDVEIVESHHNQKKDSPSGTAKKLKEAVLKTRKTEPSIHSVRAGDIVGDHTVIFAGKGERIELTHRAQSRDAFAKGALDAAKFLIGKKPGLYSMADVINKP